MPVPVLTPIELRAPRKLPRVRLAHLPTPLGRLRGYSETRRRRRVFIKRDGQARLGGNKAH